MIRNFYECPECGTTCEPVMVDDKPTGVLTVCIWLACLGFVAICSVVLWWGLS